MASDYVMIVEDNDKLSRMYSKVLRHAGYETISTPSVEESIALFEEHWPRVVCLDWRLIDGTCEPFLDHIRQLDPADAPYILVISAEVTRDDVAAYLDLIEGYYTKPIELKEMVKKVTALDG